MKRSRPSASAVPSPTAAKKHAPLSKRRRQPLVPAHPALSVADVLRMIVANLGSRDQLSLRLVCKKFASVFQLPQVSYGKNRIVWDLGWRVPRLLFAGVPPCGIEGDRVVMRSRWQSSYSLFMVKTCKKYPDCYFGASLEEGTDLADAEYGLEWSAADSAHVVSGGPVPAADYPIGEWVGVVERWSPDRKMHEVGGEVQPGDSEEQRKLRGPFGLSNMQCQDKLRLRGHAPYVRAKNWTAANNRVTPIYNYRHAEPVTWTEVHGQLLEKMAYIRKHIDEVSFRSEGITITILGTVAKPRITHRGDWTILYCSAH